MHRVIWLTDIHLNHCDDESVENFLREVHAKKPDSLVISGDFSESFQLLRYLRWIDSFFGCPCYFVLGNHDYYFSSIQAVRAEVRLACKESVSLCYLTDSKSVSLTKRWGLVGHDGWADGRIGDYERSIVMMHDYKLIEELSRVGKKERWPLLQKLGDDSATESEPELLRALRQHDQVLFVTHVPPMREACWHNGALSDDQWAPHFTCKAMGDMLMRVMAEHPQKKLTVLCGHTHGSGETTPLPNLRIITGGAVYGAPAICRIFDLE
jgi:3',5'-cyclic-AMP phosphodiesterase